MALCSAEDIGTSPSDLSHGNGPQVRALQPKLSSITLRTPSKLFQRDPHVDHILAMCYLVGGG